MSRTLGLFAILVVCACGGERPEARLASKTLRRAATWLWAQQGRDGGWHSETYGLLRGGQSLTPFVLDALLDAQPVVQPDEAALRRGVAFIARHVDSEGGLGLQGPVHDYPTYATALGIRVLRQHGGHEALVRRMQRWLLGRQLTEQHGWSRDHPAYGAWGMGGVVVEPPTPGHIDLSMTRYALEALSLAPTSEAVREARAAARLFLGRLRSPDGGYFFSTVITDKNKAGAHPEGGFRSYGTTTADALLARHFSGPPSGEPGAARALLASRHGCGSVPGLETGVGADWGVSMIYYYRAAAAGALSLHGVDEAPEGRDWRADLVGALAREQRPNGSFAAASGLMKEDDALIATALAVKALVASRSGEP